MKYLKSYENTQPKTKQDDIFYISQSSYSGEYASNYVDEVVKYYNMTEEQIHNLRLAIEYKYLDFRDFRNILGLIINSDKTDRIWSFFDSENRLKAAFNTNFKTKIKPVEKPYPICYKTWNKYTWNINKYNELESIDFNDIIGEIPKEYPFDKKYIIGQGRYRSDNNNYRTLWEEYQYTYRESEFINAIDEKNIYILTPEDIENCNLIQNANKYNIL